MNFPSPLSDGSGQRERDLHPSSLVRPAGNRKIRFTSSGYFLDENEAKSKTLLSVFLTMELAKGSDPADFLRPQALALIRDCQSSGCL